METYFLFSVHDMGYVINVFNQENITIPEAREIIQKLIDDEHLEVGIETKGRVEYVSEFEIILTQEVCTFLGDYSEDDVWQTRTDNIIL